MKIVFSFQLLIRRLARDGAAEAKVRQAETLKKGDTPVKESLPYRETQGQARDQAASVVGVSGKMVSAANYFNKYHTLPLQSTPSKLDLIKS